MMVPIAAQLIAPMVPSFIQPVASSLINAVSGKGVMRAGKWAKRWISSIISIAFNDDISGKEFTRIGRRYNNMDQIDKYV